MIAGSQHKRLILVGGGGHCKSCIETIEAEGAYTVTGILDLPAMIGNSILGYPVIGTEDEAGKWKDDHVFLITVGQIRDSILRRKIAAKLRDAGCRMATIVSPYARVSTRATLGEGTIVLHHATVNADVSVGDHAIINTAAIVEHDCRIGNFVHISTSAVVNGNCTIGNDVFIGSNAVLVNGITVGNDIVAGAGALIHRSIKESGTYAGNPCRKIG